MRTMVIREESELSKVVDALLDYAGDRRLFLLTGDLGAGKTALVKAFGRRVGVLEPVVSPTFSLVNEYTYSDSEGNPAKVFHIDLYRLEELDEAIRIGMEEYLEGHAWCWVEWPELIEPLAPPDAIRIKIQIQDDSSRKILFL